MNYGVRSGNELKKDRIKSSARIVAISVVQTIIVSIVPFIIRSLMILRMGETYAGLNSVLVSIMSVLNMTELGLSGAIVFFLYEPISNGDYKKVEAYLALIRKIYLYLALIIFIVGTAIAPFLPFVVNKDSVHNHDLFISYFAYLVAICISYCLSPEVSMLANASLRGDVDKAINLLSCLVAYILEIVAILVYRSFILYYVALIVQSVFAGILRCHIKRKYYEEFSPSGVLQDGEKKELKKRVIALLGHQMNDKFISSIDFVVLSSFVGLSTVARYGNYMYVVYAVSLAMLTVFSSLTASIGNAFVTEDTASNYTRFRTMLWLDGILTAWFCICMASMYQPFMKIWVGDFLFPYHTVLLFCIYCFCLQIRQTVVLFKNACGMWWEDRLKPYISMAVNLFLDIILVIICGVDGALLSTILCLSFIEIPWEANVIYKGYFKMKTTDYYRSVLSFFALTAIVSAIAIYLCDITFVHINILNLLGRGVMCTILFGIVVLLLFHKNEYFIIWVNSILSLRKKGQ
jgi:hypothetical protein